jgi:hypothetical protein
MIFDNFAINSSNAPLPVTFLGLVAKKNDNGTVKLLWDVGEEINVNSYSVEKSSNGTDFTAIGSVPATGKSTYSLVDNQTSELETRYYRVKNIDIDGRSKYTPIIKVAGKRTSGHIQLYPVPAHDHVYVQHDNAPSEANITLFYGDGRLMRQVRAIPGSYQTYIDISGLGAGMYILKYDDGRGDIQAEKMIKF